MKHLRLPNWQGSELPVWPPHRPPNAAVIELLAKLTAAEAEAARLRDHLKAILAEALAHGHGISMIHMTKEKMEQIQVPVPPLAEQQPAIARWRRSIPLLRLAACHRNH